MKLQQQIELAIKHAALVNLAGYRVYAVNSTVNFSEVAGELAKKGPFGVVWFVRSDGKYQYSLRSEGDFDVSAIAKSFGGGGHKNAAGFEADELVFNKTNNLVGKTIKVPKKICESEYVYIYGYDPTGVNPFQGCPKPHYVVYECTIDGERLGTTRFNITETEMEGYL
jgi:hypothetical protein